MSHTSASCRSIITKKDLLNLFLGRGEVLVQLEGQTVTLQKIERCIPHISEESDKFIVKLDGVSSLPQISQVIGTGELTLVGKTGYCTLDINLELHDEN